MTEEIIQSGELQWHIIKEDENIKVLINHIEFAKLPIHIFPNEQEALDTAKYNIVNELVKELELTSFGIRNGICRPLDKRSNKPLITFLGNE